MPSRQQIIVIAALTLISAGVGVVLGKRGDGASHQGAAKTAGGAPHAALIPEQPKLAKPESVLSVDAKTWEQQAAPEVGVQLQTIAPEAKSTEAKAPAAKPIERYEFKTAAQPKAEPAVSSQTTIRTSAPSKSVESGTGKQDESDLVFVNRKDLLRARNAANEAAAISTLRSVASAQAMAQASGVIDSDGDALGEYGYFAELSGATPCRAAPGAERYRLQPPILSTAFGEVSKSGNVLRSGYVFRMYLPGATARNKKTPGIPEPSGGSWTLGDPRPDGHNCEVFWALYAWPIDAPATGARAFFLNQEGDLLTMANTDNSYSGEQRAPTFDAAFSAKTPGDMAAAPVPGAKCNDGHVWSVLELGDTENESPLELGFATEADLEINAQPDSERMVVSRTLLRRANMGSNEAGAIQTLRMIASAQAQIQAAGAIDTDGDSIGEYAFFAELAGSVSCRAAAGSTPQYLRPALLGSSFGKITSAGNALRSGYIYRIYLPGTSSLSRVAGIAESAAGGSASDRARPDHDNSETMWAVYAWPIEAGKSGTRAYFMNQEGELFFTANEDGAYDGEAHAPQFDAAYGAERRRDMRASPPERDGKGNDGHVWRPAM